MFSFFVLTTAVSCNAYNSVSKITEQVTLGMHVEEFKKIAKNRAEKDAMFSDYYVYRINQINLDGYVIDTKFYYFRNSDDRLFEVNGGTSK